MAPEAAGDRWPAPAKLNLFLHVTGRREDGYHELQTVFQLLDWGDSLSIDVLDEPRIVRSRDLPGIPASHDLSLRAALMLQRETGCRQGAIIDVDKAIPAGAGLGGGSSDAATVLVVLNHMWDCGLSVGELADMGLGLGADVPVFVRGRSAWAEGVGEQLIPIELGERHYLLVFAATPVSTAEVFASPHLRRDTSPITREAFFAGEGRNDCEPVVLDMHPDLRRMATELGRCGPVTMTGTGSSFFISLPSREVAERAASELKCRYNVRAATGVSNSPLHQKLEQTVRRG